MSSASNRRTDENKHSLQRRKVNLGQVVYKNTCSQCHLRAVILCEKRHWRTNLLLKSQFDI